MQRIEGPMLSGTGPFSCLQAVSCGETESYWGESFALQMRNFADLGLKPHTESICEHRKFVGGQASYCRSGRFSSTAMLHYLITLILHTLESGSPYKTLRINLIGSSLFGCTTAWVLKGAVGPRMELFLETGLCGGSTTFSTFALEAAGLLWRGSWGEACIYIALSASPR